jgi:hypothetical protein
MDPDAALREIRALVFEQLHGDKADPDRLAELIDGLDGWIRAGGFLPSSWQQPPIRVLPDPTPAPEEEEGEPVGAITQIIANVPLPEPHWHGLRRCTQAHPWPSG